jgi:YebC/PmpR family DNA-binding regulatory protein
MAGHSKWSQIKRKKAVTDNKRGQLFTKLLREIQVAASHGGANPAGNVRLRTAIIAAKSQSIPIDNIERAIKRGAGDLDGEVIEEVVYEAYGPGGVALLIRTFTDNRNRTVASLRHALSRNGGTLGATNSVAYIFTKKGIARLPKSVISYDDLLELTVEYGVEEIEDQDNLWEIQCDAKELSNLINVIEPLFDKIESEFRDIPTTLILVDGAEATNLLSLLEAIEDIDDVQNVAANFEMKDDFFNDIS